MALNRTYGKILGEGDFNLLLGNIEDHDLKSLCQSIFYYGTRLKEIDFHGFSKSSRSYQKDLSEISEKVLGRKVTFTELRQSCAVNLLNKGYTKDYVRNYMRYSKLEGINKRMRSMQYVAPKVRLQVLERDKFRCVWCGDTERLHIDHIIPLSKGGKSRKSNLQTLCDKCNQGKKNKLVFKDKQNLQVIKGENHA